LDKKKARENFTPEQLAFLRQLYSNGVTRTSCHLEIQAAANQLNISYDRVKVIITMDSTYLLLSPIKLVYLYITIIRIGSTIITSVYVSWQSKRRNVLPPPLLLLKLLPPPLSPLYLGLSIHVKRDVRRQPLVTVCCIQRVPVPVQISPSTSCRQ
jgi:hypothetical protein